MFEGLINDKVSKICAIYVTCVVFLDENCIFYNVCVQYTRILRSAYCPLCTEYSLPRLNNAYRKGEGRYYSLIINQLL